MRTIGLASKGMARIPLLAHLLDAQVRLLRPGGLQELDAVAGWGCKRSGERAAAAARRGGLPCLFLEDGFLRSFGTGDRFPPLSNDKRREGVEPERGRGILDGQEEE